MEKLYLDNVNKIISTNDIISIMSLHDILFAMYHTVTQGVFHKSKLPSY